MKKLFCMLSLLCASQVKAQLPAYLPSYGLTAWFPFTGNAIDSTNNGHNGTVSGCTMAKGRTGVANTAFRFNGINNYIYIPAGTFERQKSVDITASLTISAWVKSVNYFYNSQSQIYWRGDATPAHDPHMLYFNSGQVKIRRDIDPGSTINEVGTSIATLDTNFHLMTGTYDSVSGMMRIYLDGVEKNSSYLPGLQTYPTATMYNYIGAVDGGTAQFFYGIIDELGIWNRALTPCEIAALYGSVPNIVTNQPTSDSVSAGTTVAFTAGVTAPSSTTYQWQVNTGTGFTNLTNTAPYSGVTTATLTITPAHYFMNNYWYRCVVSAGTCTQTTDSAQLKVSFSVGVNNIAATAASLQIIPQPATGTFTIACDGVGNNELTIEITDVAGRIVHTEKATPDNGRLNKIMDMSNTLKNGIYFVQVTSANVNKKTRLVIAK